MVLKSRKQDPGFPEIKKIWVPLKLIILYEKTHVELNFKISMKSKPRSWGVDFWFPSMCKREYPSHKRLVPLGQVGISDDWLCLTSMKPEGLTEPPNPGLPGNPAFPLSPMKI